MLKKELITKVKEQEEDHANLLKNLEHSEIFINTQNKTIDSLQDKAKKKQEHINDLITALFKKDEIISNRLLEITQLSNRMVTENRDLQCSNSWLRAKLEKLEHQTFKQKLKNLFK